MMIIAIMIFNYNNNNNKYYNITKDVIKRILRYYL